MLDSTGAPRWSLHSPPFQNPAQDSSGVPVRARTLSPPAPCAPLQNPGSPHSRVTPDLRTRHAQTPGPRLLVFYLPPDPQGAPSTSAHTLSPLPAPLHRLTRSFSTPPPLKLPLPASASLTVPPPLPPASKITRERWPPPAGRPPYPGLSGREVTRPPREELGRRRGGGGAGGGTERRRQQRRKELALGARSADPRGAGGGTPTGRVMRKDRRPTLLHVGAR